MNITFALTCSYEQEFRSSNLVNNDIVIEHISAYCESETIGSCIVLDAINNMQEHRQSPLVVINDIYQCDKVNIVVPKTSKWRFFVTDKEGNRVNLHSRLIVNLVVRLWN